MRAFVLSGLLLFGTAAIAAETITYTYDARGRLISVVHSGGPSSGLTTTYSLDDADNRTSKTTSSGGGGGTTCSGVSFSVGNASATEGSNLSFTITKSGTTADSCSVNYATANNSAAAPGDYTSTNGTLTFTSAQSSKTVTVTIVDDTLVESAETMYLNLSNPTGSATISDAQGVGTGLVCRSRSAGVKGSALGRAPPRPWRNWAVDLYFGSTARQKVWRTLSRMGSADRKSWGSKVPQYYRGNRSES